MKRPSFQFYPADWASNTKLRRCSFRERGVWLEVMGLMHDSDEYGVLRWTLGEIVSTVGCKLADLDALLARSVMKGLASGAFPGFEFRPSHGRKLGPPVTLIAPCAGPIFFSSRMVEDEYKRVYRGAGTRFGAVSGADEPTAGPVPSHAPTHGQGGGASSSSSSSSKSYGLLRNPSGEEPPDDPVFNLSPPLRAKAERAAALAAGAREILAFLNEKTGKRFPETDSNVGIIAARLREGFSTEQCRQVVAMKVRNWSGDPKTVEWLRPATIFGRTNFSNYVGELVVREDGGEEAA